MRGALSRLFGEMPPEPTWVDVATLRAQMAGAAAPLIIDVRGADEFDGPLGHIDGAVLIPLPELGARRNEIAGTGRPVVCVCLSDKRSSAAAAQLASAGVDQVSVLRGGMKAWREAGL
jgi:rhodanese-related sulfurtransferase